MEGVKKIHIIGICGTLMGAFAAYLKRQGLDVTGSDQNVYPPMSDVLKKAGVVLFEGYQERNLTTLSPKPDLVVIGNVIQAKNPEAKAAMDLKYHYTSLPEAMETFLLKNSRNLVVSGTHGKTTTSSLLAHTLVVAGKDPSYFIGGVSHDLPHSFHVSDQNRFFVLEGDEYDTAFWDKVPKFNHYLPNDVILTSIEYDHADIYPDIDAVFKAFCGLVDRIRNQPPGNLIACLDDELVRKIISRRKEIPVTTYARNKDLNPDYYPDEISQTEMGVSFKVKYGKTHKSEVSLSLKIPGLHNILNATAVWILCKKHGISDEVIAKAFESYRGVKRRQELRAEISGIQVIDDFAHHPTAVRETLSAFRKKFPNRRLITVFEPRSATSRRKVFQKEYAQAFHDTDEVYISKPHDQSSIASDQHFSSEQLVEELRSLGENAFLMHSIESGIELVSKKCQPGDIILVLSNGGFGGFIPKLIDSLNSKYSKT